MYLFNTNMYLSNTITKWCITLFTKKQYITSLWLTDYRKDYKKKTTEKDYNIDYKKTTKRLQKDYKKRLQKRLQKKTTKETTKKDYKKTARTLLGLLGLLGLSSESTRTMWRSVKYCLREGPPPGDLSLLREGWLPVEYFLVPLLGKGWLTPGFF